MSRRKQKVALTVKPKVGEVQAGPRAAQAHPLNYLSVSTIDPSRLASAFAAADQGYLSEQAKLYELIEEQDTHVFGDMTKRRLAITSLGFKFDPPKDANQSEIDRTVELEDSVRSIPRFADMHFDITDAISKGFSAQEMEWGTGDLWLPKQVHFIPQRMFQTEMGTGVLQYLRNGLGEPLRPFGWVVHSHRAKSGYIESAALFRVLAWAYAYKAYDIMDMQKFLELYGLPLRLGKYPAGIDSKQRDELLKAVRNIGNNGAGVIPNTMTIDFIQAAKAGTVDDFLKAVEWWERKQSIAILGGTLTSQADGKTSTNALGNVHNEVRREIMLHDAQQIEPTINQQLIQPIALINGMFTADRMPKFTYLTEETAAPYFR